jgi:hypothetical protein
MFKGTVIGPFCILGKTTGGKLPALQMIANTVTADSLTGARVVTTATSVHIPFLFAFHEMLLHVLSAHNLISHKMVTGNQREGTFAVTTSALV